MAQRIPVGVTGNARRFSPSWWCLRMAIWLAGGRAIRISPKQPRTGEDVAALVISGGDDIDPALYGGEKNEHAEIDPHRDELELQWIKYAIAHHIPVLGICRGEQLLNVAFGGTLHADIRAMRRHTRNRPSLLPTKKVRLAPHCCLREITGRKRLWVNSLHHQAVHHLGDAMRSVAKDRDNLVQAIEHQPGEPWMGVQWHPEYLFYLPKQFALFRWLIKRGRSQP